MPPSISSAPVVIGDPGISLPSIAHGQACQQVAGGEQALAIADQPVSGVACDLDALEDELRELDLTASMLVRSSLKRAFDVLASAAALLVLLPLFLVIAALIKLTDGGPIFFVQRRVGLRGQTFRMLKFRSMVIHAERLRPRLEVRNESNGPVFKMRLDPRVTPVGAFIRRYSLDELPQLINVLKGDMSLVGPRPLPVGADEFEEPARARHAVPPGITGPWQVEGGNALPYADMVDLDLTYVATRTLGYDLQLLARTLPALLIRRSAF